MRFFAAVFCPALFCLSAHLVCAPRAIADESDSWYRPHRIFPSDPYGPNEYHPETTRPHPGETMWDALGLPRSLDDDSLIDERLEAAERLRRLGERAGSERLIDAARRIEERAHEQQERADDAQEWRQQQERRAEQAYEQQRRREEQQYQQQLRRQEQAYEQQRRREQQYEQQQRLDEQPRQARRWWEPARRDDEPGRWWRGPRPAAPQPAVQGEPTMALSAPEQRLADQFDMAARLRELARRNRNPRLNDAADELEESALEEYQKSLESQRTQTSGAPR